MAQGVDMAETLDMSIQYLKGVGPQRAALFEKLDVRTLRDLVGFFPRGYQDMTDIRAAGDLRTGETAAFFATLDGPVRAARIRPGMEVFKGRLAGDGGVLELVFFNQRWAAQSLKPGVLYLFYGRIEGNLLKKEIVNPYFEPASEARKGRILPLYRLTAGLTQTMVRKAAAAALELFPDDGDEILSDSLRMENQLATRAYALRNIHFPRDRHALELARQRLVFEELLVFQAALQRLRRAERAATSIQINTDIDLAPFMEAAGFQFTGAQRRAVDECLGDFARGVCMNRLIQGDVGSGKTAVAAALVYIVTKNGLQAALMAPTEVLAVQHYETLSPMLAGLGVRTGLITGGTPAKQRRETLAALADGALDLLIGTHAVVSDDVKFHNLALVVTDEQHRFGVRQRELLQQKGARRPHVLVMSATPIPRTLALILYAELDISVIDELPPGRRPVRTFHVDSTYRARLYGFVKKQAQEGRQAYIICPRAEDETESELKSVRTLCTELAQGYLQGLRVEYIYGRMAKKKKDELMRAFAAGEIDVLVSTTVVEVGVNVPNATVMVVENAERFGLAQLHQLRGRVGRGAAQSYCILVSDSDAGAAAERLDIMTRTNDGFKISQRDLELRGPGEFFGDRQSGLARFKIADLMTDMRVVQQSQAALQQILERDPLLGAPENVPLKSAVDQLLGAYEDGAL